MGGGASGGFSTSSSSTKFPPWARPAIDWMWQGNTPEQIDPNGTGLMSDALQASNLIPNAALWGGLASLIPQAQLGGQYARELSAQGMNQGWGNLMQLAGPTGWDTMSRVMQMAGLVPQSMDASNFYLNRGVTPGMQGANIMGAQGAGQQVVDAALGAYRALPSEAYQRIVAEGLPEVRASYSARGLGTSGQAAQGEQDYIQRTRDRLYQQDVANQIAALQTGASAAGPAAAQAIGAQNAAIGRGQLGLQAAGQIPQILGGFQDITGSPLGYMSQFAGLQGLPLSLLGQGMNTFMTGLGMPLQYQQGLYDFSRSPQLDLLSALAGTKISKGGSFSFQQSANAGMGGGMGGN